MPSLLQYTYLKNSSTPFYRNLLQLEWVQWRITVQLQIVNMKLVTTMNNSL
jgi:hypothetical protein